VLGLFITADTSYKFSWKYNNSH